VDSLHPDQAIAEHEGVDAVLDAVPPLRLLGGTPSGAVTGAAGEQTPAPAPPSNPAALHEYQVRVGELAGLARAQRLGQDCPCERSVQ
jgi:hypothetical protein